MEGMIDKNEYQKEKEHWCSLLYFAGGDSVTFVVVSASEELVVVVVVAVVVLVGVSFPEFVLVVSLGLERNKFFREVSSFFFTNRLTFFTPNHATNPMLQNKPPLESHIKFKNKKTYPELGDCTLGSTIKTKQPPSICWRASATFLENAWGYTSPWISNNTKSSWVTTTLRLEIQGSIHCSDSYREVRDRNAEQHGDTWHTRYRSTEASWRLKSFTPLLMIVKPVYTFSSCILLIKPAIDSVTK